MCGIAGIVSQNTSLVNNHRLRQMSDAIAHRGPDGDGVWINDTGRIGLAHRRLSIIDLSPAAAQPMLVNADGSSRPSYAIVYNGEIYNYLEIKKALQGKGHAFHTESDTEVVLAAYNHWGTDCLQHFDGMFAFAIWDESKQRLFCARDRFGEKPFFFYQDNDQFIFASEMKALWAVGVAKINNNDRLLQYLGNGMVHDHTRPSGTFYKNIYSLPPAHFLFLDVATNESSIIAYWDLDKESIDLNITEAGAIEELQELLTVSVARRLRSDVPVGTSLSGGLDSSSIVALIKALQPGNGLQTFSAVFPGFEKDESKHIQEVADKFHLQDSQVSPSANGWVDDFEKVMYHQEEPFQSSSIYIQYKVYELAKQHGVTVILDGQGADETLAGYHKYYNWYWQELLAAKHFSMAKQEAKETASLGIDIPWGWQNKLAAFMPGAAAKQLGRKAYSGIKQHPFLQPDFVTAYAEKTVKPIVRKLNDILYFDTMQSGLQTLLRYSDRNSMAHGREVRLPFLNHELVQFIFSLPSHFKIHQGWGKWVLRKTMDNSLPLSITWRKDKIGYEPPQQQWMQQPRMQDKIMDSRKKLVSAGMLEPAILQQPIMARPAHEADNHDFRYLCVAGML